MAEKVTRWPFQFVPQLLSRRAAWWWSSPQLKSATAYRPGRWFFARIPANRVARRGERSRIILCDSSSSANRISWNTKCARNANARVLRVVANPKLGVFGNTPRYCATTDGGIRRDLTTRRISRRYSDLLEREVQYNQLIPSDLARSRSSRGIRRWFPYNTRSINWMFPGGRKAALYLFYCSTILSIFVKIDFMSQH